jgi:predicted N-acyltransferase
MTTAASPETDTASNAGEDPAFSNVTIKILRSINEISREEWNGLLAEDASPFLMYDWFKTLEQSGCASAQEGWDPLHIVLYNVTDAVPSPATGSATGSATESADVQKAVWTPIAATPMYVKYHSYGEFIFDQSWADYAQRTLGKARIHPFMLGNPQMRVRH